MKRPRQIKMKLIKGKLYLINWVDTFQLLGWKDEDDIHEACLKNKEWVKTVGYYVGQCECYQIFSAQHTENTEMCSWSGITAIPVGVIKRIKLLK